MQLGKESLISCGDVTAAGTSAVNGSIVDMANYEGVVFVINIGTAASDNTVKVQQGAASDMSDAADLEGTANASDGTEKTIIIDVFKPEERYLRPVVTRGTSTTIQSITAIKYCPRSIPTDNDASTDNSFEAHVSPSEGTA